MVVPFMQVKICSASQIFCSFFFEIALKSGHGIYFKKFI